MILKPEPVGSGADYRLDRGTVWINVGDLRVCVQRTDDGVVCDMYARGDEERGAIASCYAFDGE